MIKVLCDKMYFMEMKMVFIDAFGMTKLLSLIFCYKTLAHLNFTSWCLDAW
jgi:hypothetical protein